MGKRRGDFPNFHQKAWLYMSLLGMQHSLFVNTYFLWTGLTAFKIMIFLC